MAYHFGYIPLSLTERTLWHDDKCIAIVKGEEAKAAVTRLFAPEHVPWWRTDSYPGTDQRSVKCACSYEED